MNLNKRIHFVPKLGRTIMRSNILELTKLALSQPFKFKASLSLSASLLVACLGTGSAYAEDIEIYSNAFSNNGLPLATDPALRPNLLFILDNSTSMGRTGRVPVPGLQNIPLSQVPNNNSERDGTINNPVAIDRINADIAGHNVGNNPNEDSVCGDPHSGATGEVDSKNLYFFYQIQGSNPASYNVDFCETRLDTMRRSLSEVLSVQADPADTLNGINVGIMRFNRNFRPDEHAGTVVSAIQSIDAPGARQATIDAINAIDFGVNTPIAESMHEAYLYYTGRTILDGRTTLGIPGGTPVDHSDLQVDFDDNRLDPRLPYVTDPAARSGNTYISPIETQCQDNTIVFLSDGLPTSDNFRDSLISQIIPGSCSTCSDNIAAYMNTNDVLPASHFTAGETPFEANINTIAIGLNIDSQVLRNMGAAGTGVSPAPEGAVAAGNNLAGEPFDAINPSQDYFTVARAQDLEGVFRDITLSLAEVESDAFAAAAISVDSFSRLQNRDDLYFALFQPLVNTQWPGNVKRYRLTIDPNIVPANEIAAIVDEDDQLAITDEGLFVETARSFWLDPASAPDGNLTAAGGAASNVDQPRNLFGFVGGTEVFLGGANDTAAVNNFLNTVVDTNAINIGELGPDAAALDQNREEIARFSLSIGVDESGNVISNEYLGDNLHGTPYVLSFGANANNFQDTIFYTSNQGMLHAIDGETGEELWAYIPDEDLFENLGAYANALEGEKIYGLDAEISFSVERDASTNQEIDEAVLFFGQRRGGRKLFAVDITNARATTGTPFQALWTVDPSNAGMGNLGQTWAEPVVTRVNYCTAAPSTGCDDIDIGVSAAQFAAQTREVLFVSGGYDEQYDDASASVQGLAGNVQGNAIYMLDAENGDLLWMASNSTQNVADAQRDLVIPEMQHSIVSRPTVLDANFNGVADTIFFTDVAGQVFRIDFRTSTFDSEDVSDDDNSNAKSTTAGTIDSVSGGMIASFAENGVDRRFFNSLNITLLDAVTGEPNIADAPLRYAIAMGSGYRAHPLDPEPNGNNIYVLYDENISVPLSAADLDGNASPTEAIYTYDTSGATPTVYQANDFVELPLAGINVNSAVINSTTPNQQLTGGLDLSNAVGNEFPTNIGFRVPLNVPGEKIIAPALINNSQLLLSSYIPDAQNSATFSQTCEAGLGNSIFYGIDLGAGAVFVEVLDREGISPEPVIISLPTTSVNAAGDQTEILQDVILVGTEIISPPGASGTCEGNTCNLGRASKSVWWETDRAR